MFYFLILSVHFLKYPMFVLTRNPVMRPSSAASTPSPRALIGMAPHVQRPGLPRRFLWTWPRPAASRVTGAGGTRGPWPGPCKEPGERRPRPPVSPRRQRGGHTTGRGGSVQWVLDKGEPQRAGPSVPGRGRLRPCRRLSEGLGTSPKACKTPRQGDLFSAQGHLGSVTPSSAAAVSQALTQPPWSLRARPSGCMSPTRPSGRRSHRPRTRTLGSQCCESLDEPRKLAAGHAPDSEDRRNHFTV